jgi:Flp pilus assembly protein TadG
MNSLRTRSRVLSTASANFASKLARFRRRARSERGSSLVEFALTLPLLMVVATGIFAFGIALNNYLELTNAVTIGAQLLADSRGVTGTPCTNAVNAIYNAAPNLTAGNLAINFTFSNNGTTNQYTTASACDTASQESGSPIFAQGESVELIATYPCTLAGYGFNFGCSLTANITEIVQ